MAISYFSENVTKPLCSHLPFDFEIFLNYFEVVEPNYDFLNNQTNAKTDMFVEIVEAKVDDEINLGILLQAGSFSEIWTGN